MKEITESVAAYAHASKYIFSEMDCVSKGVVRDAILCIGDGSTPRSAAMFALYKPDWECYSIDPQLREVVVKKKVVAIRDILRLSKTKKHDSNTTWIFDVKKVGLCGTVSLICILLENASNECEFAAVM